MSLSLFLVLLFSLMIAVFGTIRKWSLFTCFGLGAVGGLVSAVIESLVKRL